MSNTIEFFSADPKELVSVLALEDVDEFLREIGNYPRADFSLHLYIPEDLDSLCQAMRSQGLFVPPIFRELLLEQLYYDDSSGESLTRLNRVFAEVWADLDDQQVENIARIWSADFPDQEEVVQNALKAMRELRQIAQDVMQRDTSLLLRLVYSSFVYM